MSSSFSVSKKVVSFSILWVGSKFGEEEEDDGHGL